VISPRIFPRPVTGLLGAIAVLALAACQGPAPAAPGGAQSGQNPLCHLLNACGQPPVALGPKAVPMAGAVEATGALLYPRRNALVAFDLQSRQSTPIATFAANASLSTPATSPDRSRVALTVYTPSTDPKDLGGADLYVVDVASGEQRLLLPHDGSGVWLSEPAWSADGQTIYYTKRATILENGKYRGEAVSVERVGADGGTSEAVAQNASSPTLSADGRYLAYLSPVGGTEPARLWVATIDGADPRQLVGPGFTQIAFPRFAPTGTQLVFAGVGGPARGHAPPSGGSSLARILGPAIAEAHGIPWDLWIVNADGSGLTRITDVGEDSPVPAWSPDGSYIAFSGEIGLYLVQPATRETSMLAQEPASGVVWVPVA